MIYHIPVGITIYRVINAEWEKFVTNKPTYYIDDDLMDMQPGWSPKSNSNPYWATLPGDTKQDWFQFKLPWPAAQPYYAIRVECSDVVPIASVADEGMTEKEFLKKLAADSIDLFHRTAEADPVSRFSEQGIIGRKLTKEERNHLRSQWAAEEAQEKADAYQVFLKPIPGVDPIEAMTRAIDQQIIDEILEQMNQASPTLAQINQLFKGSYTKDVLQANAARWFPQRKS